MQHFNAGTLDGQPVEFNRTVHGPGDRVRDRRRPPRGGRRASARATCSTAWTCCCSSGSRAASIPNAQTFIKAAAVSPQTFNTFYADNKRHRRRSRPGGCRCAPPAWTRACPPTARASYEWRGFEQGSKDTRTRSSRSGVLNNWNNKPARGFPAADDQWSYGSIKRVDLLNDNTAKVKRHTLATLTGAMNAAATQDVRVDEVRAGAGAAAEGRHRRRARARASMLELLEAWRAKGGSRLDRDLDGKIDDPGAAILDTAWNRLADAAMTPVLGKPLADQLSTTLHRALRPAARRPVRRLAHVHGQGPARAAGREGEGPVREPLLRRRRPRRRAGRRCGRRSRRPAWSSRRRRGRTRTRGARTRHAERIKFAAGPAPVHDALHEPADRHPAGHRVQGTPLARHPPRSRHRLAACVKSRAVRFEKWQALGNDYVIVEERELPFELTPARVRALCAPHTGVGSDGVLLLSETDERGFVAEVRIFNPDGSEAELSGNGVREAVMYLRRQRLDATTTASRCAPPRARSGRASRARHLHDRHGPRAPARARATSRRAPTTARGTLDAGRPRVRVPVRAGGQPAVLDRGRRRARGARPAALRARRSSATSCSRTARTCRSGGATGDAEIRARIFERGVGETMSSGTGATGAAVAAVLRGVDEPGDRRARRRRARGRRWARTCTWT